MIPGFYRVAGINTHINKLLRILFSRSQMVQRKIRTTIPTVDDLDETEECEYKSGATVKKYKKIDGVIYYQDWTTV